MSQCQRVLAFLKSCFRLRSICFARWIDGYDQESKRIEKMIELKIYPELRDWIDPLTADEFAMLEASILAEGCRDPIVTWGLDSRWSQPLCYL